MSRYHACWAYGDPGVEPDFKFCSRCAVLLDGMDLADIILEPPPPRDAASGQHPLSAEHREPGCDDVRPAKPKRDAKWLLWAANKRGCLRFFQAFGREHGFPRNMLQWSPGMVAIAVEAKVAELQPR